MLQQHGVKPAVIKWKLQRAGGLERDLPALSGALGQIARGVHEWLAEVDARNPAAIGRGQKARRSADARADVKNRHVGGDPSQLGKLGGRCESAGVKLVEGAQLLGREPLILRPEGRERRLQPFGQAGRAIVVADVIKGIGHCKAPLSLQAVVAISGPGSGACGSSPTSSEGSRSWQRGPPEHVPAGSNVRNPPASSLAGALEQVSTARLWPVETRR